MAKPGGGNGGGGGGPTTTYKGTKGDDWIEVLSNDALATTTYDGSGGNDTLDLSALTHGVTIKLNNSARGNSILYPSREFTGIYFNVSLSDPAGRLTGTIKNIENLVGTSHNDFLMIDSGSTPKRIDGGGGNDALGANGGNALLIGGAGSDWLLAYWSGNVMVGGTYVNGVAAGDGETDYFVSGGNNVVLDFEVGIDRLLFESPGSDRMDAVLNGHWETTTWNGQDAVTFVVSGDYGTFTLVGVTLEQTAQITFGFVVAPSESAIYGGSFGDDVFYSFDSVAETIVLGSGSGHDLSVFFDPAQDRLNFVDDTAEAISWKQVFVNGMVALEGTYDGGASSISLIGLTLDDLAAVLDDSLFAASGSDVTLLGTADMNTVLA